MAVGSVRDLVVRREFDRELGARPLRRAIERLVVAPLRRYLRQRPGPEGRTLALDGDGDRVTVRKLPAPRPAGRAIGRAAAPRRPPPAGR
ncbi:MAG: hypothetical protein HYV63_05640 [Candidatus Schekmanbacteria bacterium]|nr:hypothetical protein [Candidatus Schekmanbacteria bacterium]